MTDDRQIPMYSDEIMAKRVGKELSAAKHGSKLHTARELAIECRSPITGECDVEILRAHVVSCRISIEWGGNWMGSIFSGDPRWVKAQRADGSDKRRRALHPGSHDRGGGVQVWRYVGGGRPRRRR